MSQNTNHYQYLHILSVKNKTNQRTVVQAPASSRLAAVTTHRHHRDNESLRRLSSFAKSARMNFVSKNQPRAGISLLNSISRVDVRYAHYNISKIPPNNLLKNHHCSFSDSAESTLIKTVIKTNSTTARQAPAGTPSAAKAVNRNY